MGAGGGSEGGMGLTRESTGAAGARHPEGGHHAACLWEIGVGDWVRVEDEDGGIRRRRVGGVGGFAYQEIRTVEAGMFVRRLVVGRAWGLRLLGLRRRRRR